MKKTIIIAIAPLLFIDACSSVQPEKINTAAKHQTTSIEAIQQITGSNELIRVNPSALHKSLIIQDSGELQHGLIVKALEIKPEYNTHITKNHSSSKSYIRVKF